MRNLKLRRKLSWDEKGALEGLPLYLIILVVITAIAIVIIITWLSTMQKPDLDRLEINISGGSAPNGTVYQDETYTIEITAIGTNNKELEGVSIKLEGADVAITQKTNNKGVATFTGIKPDLPPNTYTGSITVTATYSGNIPVTKITDIPVNTK